jgi:phosphopentomutase
MKSLYDMINGEINDYDYKVAMEEFDKQLDDITKGIDDDDLYGELGGLGIDKPRD